MANSSASPDPKTLHLVGIGVKHSIAPPMHNHIASSLSLPWTFHSTECPTIQDVLTLARLPSTQGLVVTMPYKASVMPHLDALDPLAIQLGACNNVYLDEGKLRGTNTDWLGIKGCLLEKGARVEGKPGLIVGAGGASRAAVYALSSHLTCSKVYVLNRDDVEVDALIQDSKRLDPVPEIVHVKSIEQARDLETPYYIVSCVPDLEPQTLPEKISIQCLAEFLGRKEKGVLLDMCFKPRLTRIIKLAEREGWETVEGTHVIGYQVEEQWRLWTGGKAVDEEKWSKKIDREGAWKVLLEAAESSAGINF
ncbi:related to pentafunctional arom polypeptide [Phialocephala subalpina]|uniref:Related to pentafunctional arom polypeptide n=1 Tax=Phialocephala subalpina TaxID=576137 RepID=A0A1L7WLB7_9HELO|nr:related to pentafunctional arom polypeptide [Phialocephala subalpina]